MTFASRCADNRAANVDRTARALQAIAEVLEIPVTAFFATVTLNPDRERQTAEMLRAFDRILDPAEREACLSFVQSLVPARAAG